MANHYQIRNQRCRYLSEMYAVRIRTSLLHLRSFDKNNQFINFKNNNTNEAKRIKTTQPNPKETNIFWEGNGQQQYDGTIFFKIKLHHSSISDAEKRSFYWTWHREK